MSLLIVNYGMGNFGSIVSALRYVGQENIIVSNDPDELRVADKLILPGVGNYSRAITKIKKLGLDQHIKELVLTQKKPILGICLGMQLLGSSSTEDGYNPGLGLVEGNISKYQMTGLKVPHVGYDQVKACKGSRLYENISSSPDFYFTHSYRMTSNSSIGQSWCFYGEEFIASFELENIAGVQFHPELSQTNGLKLLRNFIELF